MGKPALGRVSDESFQEDYTEKTCCQGGFGRPLFPLTKPGRFITLKVLDSAKE
jgi:hypothetical protein